ncbi:MAG: hypothetical protein WA705_29985 [Candidatus Ozemobacteraceae bacterium]
MSGPLIICTGLTLLGKGPSFSRIISTATDAAIILIGIRPVVIGSLSCRLMSEYGDVLLVENPNSRVENCSFSGGKNKGFDF